MPFARLFAATYAAHALICFGRKNLPVSKLNVSTDADFSGASLWTVSVVETMYLACYTASLFVIAPLGDRYSARGLLCCCFVVAGLCTAACSLATSATQLAVVRARVELSGGSDRARGSVLHLSSHRLRDMP
jgi:MFS family permease